MKFREIISARQKPAFPSSRTFRYRAGMPAIPGLLVDPISAAVGLFAGLAVGILLRIVSGSSRW